MGAGLRMAVRQELPLTVVYLEGAIRANPAARRGALRRPELGDDAAIDGREKLANFSCAARALVTPAPIQVEQRPILLDALRLVPLPAGLAHGGQALRVGQSGL